jgi:hypothetical protein
MLPCLTGQARIVAHIALTEQRMPVLLGMRLPVLTLARIADQDQTSLLLLA